jgi:hypothetical protein
MKMENGITDGNQIVFTGDEVLRPNSADPSMQTNNEAQITRERDRLLDHDAPEIDEIMEQIRLSRLHAIQSANHGMVMLFWDIGSSVLARQKIEGTEEDVVKRCAAALRVAYPNTTGFTRHNLNHMCAFAAAWPDRRIVQAALARLPWRLNIVLINAVDDAETRLWYAFKAAEYGWSQSMLGYQIKHRAHKFPGRAKIHPEPSQSSPETDALYQIYADAELLDFLLCATPRYKKITRSNSEKKFAISEYDNAL